MIRNRIAPVVGLICALLSPGVALAQIDQARAQQYFKEAAALCEKDGGRLWGVSLCGPIVFGDPVTKTIATSEPPPSAPLPPAVGFANAALDWGGTRWTTLSWPMLGMIGSDEYRRGRLLVHELFHRIQPQLGLLLNDGDNSHLDTVEGRYLLQLEWRALARALDSTGDPRRKALGDALAFRRARHAAFPGSDERERVLEINEGLPQYTGTVVASGSADAARRDAIVQLKEAEANPTFVRTFPYPSGAAYGILLDATSPGWPRRFTKADSLPALAAAAYMAKPGDNPTAAAAAYDGVALRASELAREEKRAARVAELRKRFVDGPVLVLPPSGNNSFQTQTMMPIPGEGTVYPMFRASAPWGRLEATEALLATDRSSIRVPGPTKVEGAVLSGDGWKLELAAGWIVRPGPRAGDQTVERQK